MFEQKKLLKPSVNSRGFWIVEKKKREGQQKNVCIKLKCQKKSNLPRPSVNNKGCWVVLKKNDYKKMFVLGFRLQNNLRGGDRGGYAITLMVKKNRGGGNIANIFVGIKT